MKRLLPLLVLVIAGCVHMNKSVLVDRSDQPVPTESVHVVFFGDRLPDTCERIAELHASASEDLSSEDKVFGKFRKEAGKLGANVVSVRESYGSLESSSVFSSRSAMEYDGDAYWCPDGPGEAGRSAR